MADLTMDELKQAFRWIVITFEIKISIWKKIAAADFVDGRNSERGSFLAVRSFNAAFRPLDDVKSWTGCQGWWSISCIA